MKTTHAGTTLLTDEVISIMQHGSVYMKMITALSLAINYRQKEWVATLLEKRADVKARNLDGDIPLFLASKNEHGECVNVLIEGGADVNRQNIHGVTALINTNFEGTDRSETVKALLNAGADVNASTSTGITALMNAALYGHEKSFSASHRRRRGCECVFGGGYDSTHKRHIYGQR